ncbi:NAD-dependent epimerase/dehydratase family protein [Nostocaceae cyanobacterium CENA369]|uniref:NAD-dependent epimerase/dehydratase family protein n=1 Tax=Dendronalium phyllosphericum CENA369 TaxID=1725256 RepID=A0A8J7I8T7_9NOST|nr:NAD-dependent epimerase/dehydratase family protein [Dendronalium phyllosphericum]MBH8576318.1 NAD-dependent epimerase/dehydratase family protein [Dendronalium phyllosphericum CENA369]
MSQSKLVLVTGATGFIGRYIVRYFSKQGWSVVGLAKTSPENAPIADLQAYHCLDLPSTELNNLLDKYHPDLFIHCAGRASVGLSITTPREDFNANTALTFEVLNSLRTSAPNCRFIFLSSAAVYGNPNSIPINEDKVLSPISPYGFHKWQSENLVLEFARVYGLLSASIRIFSAYGPGLRRQVIWDICQKALTEKAVNLQGTGTESRDFIHAIDIAKAIEIVAESAQMQGEVYNLGSGRETTIKELAALVIDALEYDIQPQFNGNIRLGDPLNWQADISKIQTLGFEPSVPLEKGVKNFVNWCKAELHII